MENSEKNQKSSKIALGKGIYAVVDTEDLRRVSLFRWFFTKRKYTTYVQSNVGKGKKQYLHRFILGLGDDEMVDHINGNGLDNRKQNLRIVDKSKNMHNSKKQRSCSSLYKGVCWSKNARKWRAYIYDKDGKKIHLGYFVIEDNAALAYDRRAEEMFGEYALLNFREKTPEKES